MHTFLTPYPNRGKRMGCLVNPAYWKIYSTNDWNPEHLYVKIWGNPNGIVCLSGTRKNQTVHLIMLMIAAINTNIQNKDLFVRKKTNPNPSKIQMTHHDWWCICPKKRQRILKDIAQMRIFKWIASRPGTLHKIVTAGNFPFCCRWLSHKNLNIL